MCGHAAGPSPRAEIFCLDPLTRLKEHIARNMHTMESAIPESTSPGPSHSPLRRPNRSDIALGRTSSPPSPGRQRTISFSEDTHPSQHRFSISASGHSDYEETGNSSTEEAVVGGQNHDRDDNGQAKIPSPDDPSPSPFTSDSSEDLKQPWYRRFASNYRSVSLENKGSVARDHLALERTFLAWLRTSLAFASIGIAVTQLFRLNTSLADQKQHRKRGQDYHLNHRSEVVESLPLSPLMGASLTPEIYSQIQKVLQQQSYPIYTPLDNSASALLDQILQPKLTAFGSDPAARLRHLGKPLGATFLGISIVILLIGFHRYFESQYWIIRGQFPASRGSVALTGIVTSMLIVASLVIVLVVAPAAYNT